MESGTLTLNGLITANTTARTLFLGGAGQGIINGYFYDNGANIPALTKQDSGTWTFTTGTAYSGKTTIQGGTLKLDVNGSIPNTPTIQILSNAVFDVSAVSGGFTLGGGQTLGGNGSVLGDVTATGTVTPGAPVGTLSFSSSLALFGTTIMELNRTNAQNADLISAAAITFGGTLTITNLGPDLQAGDTFNLFDGASSGSFSETNLPALASTNLYWDVSQFGSQGIITVGSTVAISPTILPPTRSGTNLVLQVASQAGYDYVLQATPQLNSPVWTGVQTNAGGGILTFTIPISPTNPQRFFRISVQ
ncbi:MAG: autotransporter-associated beta strand repeat-containing protein [Limisphaerales bacterium]